jgi:hypothetical protein
MGLRTANSYLVEISAALTEDYVYTTLTAAVAAGPQTVTVASTDALYPGAQIVVNDANPALVEAITVTAVSIPASTLTATFANAHAINTQLLGGTFPTQQSTDPLFTQAEVLSYLARAQNEFLSKVPLIFAFSSPTISLGAIYQATPANAIEMERVALRTGYNFVQIATIARAGGVVTAQLVAEPSPDFTVGLPVYVQGVTDNSYSGGPFTLTSGTSPTSLAVSWAQAGANSTSSGGNVGPPTLTRLYETTQEQIAMRDPQWFYNARSPVPLSWFEDRTGLYGWGVAPPPQSSFPAEVLYSTRGPDTLNLLSTFAAPDLVNYLIKYKAMEYMYSKNGEMRSPQSADYCRQRFDRGVMIVDRYLQNLQNVGG